METIVKRLHRKVRVIPTQPAQAWVGNAKSDALLKIRELDTRINRIEAAAPRVQEVLKRIESEEEPAVFMSGERVGVLRDAQEVYGRHLRRDQKWHSRRTHARVKKSPDRIMRNLKRGLGGIVLGDSFEYINVSRRVFK